MPFPIEYLFRNQTPSSTSNSLFPVDLEYKTGSYMWLDKINIIAFSIKRLHAVNQYYRLVNGLVIILALRRITSSLLDKRLCKRLSKHTSNHFVVWK